MKRGTRLCYANSNHNLILSAYTTLKSARLRATSCALLRGLCHSPDSPTRRVSKAIIPSAEIITDAEQKPAGTIVVLTDGVISLKSEVPATKEEPSSARCETGDDMRCMALRVAEYVHRGNGLWIFGMRLPFTAKHFQVEKSGKFKSRGAFFPVTPAKPRPFYVWIGTLNVGQGRQMVSGLLSFAKSRVSAQDVLALEIAPGLQRGWEPKSPMLNSDVIEGAPGCAERDLFLSVPLERRYSNSLLCDWLPKSSRVGFTIPVEHRQDKSYAADVYSLNVVAQQSFTIKGPDEGVSIDANPISDLGSAHVPNARMPFCLTFADPTHKPELIVVESQWAMIGNTEKPLGGLRSTDEDDSVDYIGQTLDLNRFFGLLRKETQRFAQSLPSSTFLVVTYGHN